MATFGTASALEPHPPKAWTEAIKYPVVLLLIVVAFHWKLVFTEQYDWIWGPDLTQQVLPWFEEQSRQVHERRFPLWDPHMWAGHPLAGQAQPGTAYPLNWILFAMPRTTGHISFVALQWYYVLIHYMAALFCYLLCRDLGRSRPASLIAGLIFALSGYFASVGWPQHVNGALWAPLVFLFLLRTVRGVRPYASAAWCGAALGIAWLSGHHVPPMFMTLACGGVWLFYFLRSGRPDWRIARVALTAVALSVMVGAMQILPAAEYGRLARRWAGAERALMWNERVPYYVQHTESLSPAHLPGIVIPTLSGNVHPFLGVVAFTFAVLGVALCWRERGVKLLTAIGLGSILFALGVYDVFHGFIYAVVPMVEKARTPAMALFMFACAAAALAAFAVDAAVSSPSADCVRRAARASAVFGVVILAVVVITHLAQKASWPAEHRVFMPGAVAVLLAALLHGWRSGALQPGQFIFLLAGLVLLDLGTDSNMMLSGRHDSVRRAHLEKVTRNEDIAAFLSTQPQPFRVETDGDTLATNWGEYHNINFFQAYTPSVTLNLAPLEFHTRQTKRLFNVRYTLAKSAPEPEMKEVFRGEGGANVYEDTAAFPRAWTVHELVRITDPDQGRGNINDIDGMRREAFFKDAPPGVEACGGADDVRFAAYTPSRVVLKATMSCRGMLVLADTMYPGWRAYVDGKRVAIHEVNFGMRGVVVPAGTHEVRFSFRPVAVYAGAGLTLLGLLAASGIARLTRGKDFSKPERSSPR